MIISKNRYRLNATEQNILELIAQGLRPVEISKQIFLSPRTIETYVYNLRQKFEVKTTPQLIALAIVEGLIFNENTKQVIPMYKNNIVSGLKRKIDSVFNNYKKHL